MFNNNLQEADGNTTTVKRLSQSQVTAQQNPQQRQRSQDAMGRLARVHSAFAACTGTETDSDFQEDVPHRRTPQDTSKDPRRCQPSATIQPPVRRSLHTATITSETFARIVLSLHRWKSLHRLPPQSHRYTPHRLPITLTLLRWAVTRIHRYVRLQRPS